MYEQVTTNLKQMSDSINKLNEIQMQKDNKRRTDSLKKLPKTAAPVQPVQPVQPAIHPPQQKFNSRKQPKRHVISPP